MTTKELVTCFETPKDINETFFQHCHRSNYPETIKLVLLKQVLAWNLKVVLDLTPDATNTTTISTVNFTIFALCLAPTQPPSTKSHIRIEVNLSLGSYYVQMLKKNEQGFIQDFSRIGGKILLLRSEPVRILDILVIRVWLGWCLFVDFWQSGIRVVQAHWGKILLLPKVHHSSLGIQHLGTPILGLIGLLQTREVE